MFVVVVLLVDHYVWPYICLCDIVLILLCRRPCHGILLFFMLANNYSCDHEMPENGRCSVIVYVNYEF
jgi:hypothetical protein